MDPIGFFHFFDDVTREIFPLGPSMFKRQGPSTTTLADRDVSIQIGVTQIQRLTVTLRAVSDNHDSFSLQPFEIGILVVIKLGLQSRRLFFRNSFFVVAIGRKSSFRPFRRFGFCFHESTPSDCGMDIPCFPLAIATMPVRHVSLMPKGLTIFKKASIFSLLPVISITSVDWKST